MSKGTRKHRKAARKTRKQQAGGAFVRKGSYGCSYRPPLACANDSQPGTNGYISKLMSPYSAKEEYAKGAPVRRINTGQAFTLPATHHCKVKPQNALAANLAPCRKDPDPLGGMNVRQADLLYYKNGGKDLETKLFYTHQLLPFYRSLQGLFDGLVKLHKANYVHLDIKPENVTVEGQGPFTARFIDFGLGTEIKDALREIVDNHLHTDAIYSFWPPEMIFLQRNLFFSGYREMDENTYERENIEDLIEACIYRLQTEKKANIWKLQENYYRVPDYIMVTRDNESPLDYGEVINSLYRRPFRSLYIPFERVSSPEFEAWVGKQTLQGAREWIFDILDRPSDEELNMKNPTRGQQATMDVLGKLLKGVDMYSMGILLSFAISHLGFSAYWDDKGDVAPILYTQKGDEVDLETLEPEMREFVEGFFHGGILPMFTLINRCMDYDYMTRISAEEAAKTYANGLISLSNYMETPQFQDFMKFLES